MAVTKIRGETQVKPLTITNDEIATAADIETTKLEDGPDFLKRDGTVLMTADLDANGNTVKNLRAATLGHEAVRYDQVSGSISDELVKVSSNDTTARYLAEKLLGTAGKIVITETDDGLDETYVVNAGADLVDRNIDDLSALPDGSGYVKMTTGERGDLADLLAIPLAESEPTGFVNRADSTISFSDSTPDRRFTIQPAVTDFVYYIKGTAYTVSSPDTVDITNTEGVWFIYYNGPTLTADQTAPADLLTGVAFVAVVYWDAINSAHILLLDERHGITMDGATHEYLHNTVGTAYDNGFDITPVNPVPQGNDPNDGQIGLSDGAIRDEDILIEVTDGSPQDISPVAYIPIYYRDGSDASGIWRKAAATDLPFYGPRLVTPANAYWNNYNFGTWLWAPASDTYWVAVFIFATSNVDEPIIAIAGQNQSASFDVANNVNQLSSLNVTGLPFKEVRPLYRVLARTDTSFTEKVVIDDIKDLRTVEALVENPDTPPVNQVFGSYPFYADIPGQIDNLTVTYATAASIDTVVQVPVGVYRIGWYYEWNITDNNNENFQARLNVGATLQLFFHDTRAFYTTGWQSASGFIYYTVSSPEQMIINLQLRINPATGDTASMRNRHLEVWRVL